MKQILRVRSLCFEDASALAVFPAPVRIKRSLRGSSVPTPGPCGSERSPTEFHSSAFDFRFAEGLSRIEDHRSALVARQRCRNVAMCRRSRRPQRHRHPSLDKVGRVPPHYVRCLHALVLCRPTNIRRGELLNQTPKRRASAHRLAAPCPVFSLAISASSAPCTATMAAEKSATGIPTRTGVRSASPVTDITPDIAWTTGARSR